MLAITEGRYENGKQSKVIIERKSLGDLFGTLTSGYTRFRKEIERARKGGVSLVICVEGSYKKVRNGYKHCKRPGREIQDQTPNNLGKVRSDTSLFCR